MKDICKLEHSPNPKIDYTDIHFYVTFKPSEEYLEMAKPAGSEVATTQKTTQKIIEYLRIKPNATRKDMAVHWYN